jgi:hypothetical protein
MALQLKLARSCGSPREWYTQDKIPGEQPQPILARAPLCSEWIAFLSGWHQIVYAAGYWRQGAIPPEPPTLVMFCSLHELPLPKWARDHGLELLWTTPAEKERYLCIQYRLGWFRPSHYYRFIIRGESPSAHAIRHMTDAHFLHYVRTLDITPRPANLIPSDRGFLDRPGWSVQSK